MQRRTSRDRLKSAPYLRLKNTKRTLKCQSILFSSTPGGDALRFFIHSVANYQKNEGDPFRIFCVNSTKKCRDRSTKSPSAKGLLSLSLFSLGLKLGWLITAENTNCYFHTMHNREGVHITERALKRTIWSQSQF